jgi:hypothetical protein
LHGMSSGDLRVALTGFFGSAAGPSASVITRLDHPMAGRAAGLAERDLSDRDRLRVGRRRALQRSARRGTAVLPGHRRCPRRRAPRSWWRSPMATGESTSRGPTCCATKRRSMGRAPPSVTRASGFWGRTRGVPRHPRPALLGAQGGQRHQRPCRLRCSRRHGGCWPRSVTPRTVPTP